MEDEENLDTPEVKPKTEQIASSPLQAFIPLSDEIGPNLDEFVKEVSMASRNISSFGNDDMKHLNEQVSLHFTAFFFTQCIKMRV